MTPDPATVALCAAAVCWYCASPERYTPAAPDADGYWHHRPRKGKAEEIWCEANLVWGVLDDTTPIHPAHVRPAGRPVKDGTDASHP